MKLLLAPMTTQGLPVRVLSKLAIDRASGCWLWTGARNRDGYGAVKVAGRVIGAHVFVWSLLRGPMPRRCTDLDHRCCQRACVNPRHLEPVTHRENMRRSWQSSPIWVRRARSARS